MRVSRPFTGWLLGEDDRRALLERLPPRYAKVVGHHVTLTFGDANLPAPPPARGEVVGIADDGTGVEALVVAIDGEVGRPDGAIFHVTWSLADGREPRESNDVIARHGWRPLEPASIALTPWPLA